ncbi:MAG: glutathione S-transferase N-terminal domain-containing protein [Actinomycetota bacterium]|nr:glutathione S-transferase N-terminal domain-containing protein [Actinomycetota bacterium]
MLHDHPRSSNAQKVRLLLGVLGLEYERRAVPFGQPRPEWHLALNPVDWLLDAVATTLRPAGREVDAPAYGWRPGRGIGAEPPRREELPAAIASVAPRLEAFARLKEWVETVGGHPAWAPVAAESGVPL